MKKVDPPLSVFEQSQKSLQSIFTDGELQEWKPQVRAITETEASKSHASIEFMKRVDPPLKDVWFIPLEFPVCTVISPGFYLVVAQPDDFWHITLEILT